MVYKKELEICQAKLYTYIYIYEFGKTSTFVVLLLKQTHIRFIAAV